ncbi:hypothetical protein NGI46_13875 [Peribacillus butanolivorans]|uniref:hypothetical protein n=1 Tax=Peribacillus butanolivorans TaxID=421767 RepID=UPI00207C8E03|nr:hypothetical protein [Peribacillus butanolivorans]MCO0598521.1 hypothetical protein [Peribacillus butanolivorans]
MKTNVSSANIDKWDINWNDMSDKVICKHELIHTQMFTTTIYGSYQILIKKLIGNTEENSEFYNQLLILNYELYKESIIAHEVAATYCSVKQLDAELVENYLSTLPGDYTKYYNTLAEVLDSNIKSTYAQYLIGNMLIRICLNPNIEDDIKRNLRSYNCSLGTKNSPNSRLNLILNEIKESDFTELNDELNKIIHKKYLSLGIKRNFDYQNENDWKRLNFKTLNKLNDELGIYIYNYFVELLKERNILSSSLVEDGKRGLEQLIDSLDKTLYEKISHELNIDNLRIEGLLQNDNEIVVNKYINDSIISNRVIFKFNEKNVVSNRFPIFNKENWSVLTEQSMIHSDRVFDFVNNDLWFVVKTQKSDYTVSAICINKNMYFNEINNFNSHSLLNRKIDTNIFGVDVNYLVDTNDSIEKKLADIIQNIYSGIDSFKINKTNRQRNANRHLEEKLKNIVWYMHGDFVGWLNFLLSVKKLKFFVMNFNDENTTNRKVLTSKNKKQGSSDSVYFGALVFYSEMTPGSFIRFYNINTYELVLPLILQLIDNKKISIAESSKRKFYEQQVIRAFKVIESVWEKY